MIQIRARCCLVAAVLTIAMSGPAHAQGDASIRALRAQAEQGNAGAENDLAANYEAGTGVPQDYGEALKWYRKAAEQGLAVAQYNLGAKYDLGQGTPRDPKEALYWYRLAAAQGYGRALFN